MKPSAAHFGSSMTFGYQTLRTLCCVYVEPLLVFTLWLPSAPLPVVFTTAASSTTSFTCSLSFTIASMTDMEYTTDKEGYKRGQDMSQESPMEMSQKLYPPSRKLSIRRMTTAWRLKYSNL